MTHDPIEFISSYCDRWCERCRFTERCSTYAIEAAIGMTGDFADGLELALGAPADNDIAPQTNRDRSFAFEISDADLERAQRDNQLRRRRVGAHPLNEMARTYMVRATDWLRQHRERLAGAGDPVLLEALQVVGWDVYFIGAKLHRALTGRDRHHDDGAGEDDPVQNDWNGSAKIALISIERSEAAWRVIADGARDTLAVELADTLAALRRHVLAEFPRAMTFVRPGFDEPWRWST